MKRFVGLILGLVLLASVSLCHPAQARWSIIGWLHGQCDNGCQICCVAADWWDPQGGQGIDW